MVTSVKSCKSNLHNFTFIVNYSIIVISTCNNAMQKGGSTVFKNKKKPELEKVKDARRNPFDARFNDVMYLQWGIRRVCTECNTAILIGMPDYENAKEEGKFQCYLCKKNSENTKCW